MFPHDFFGGIFPGDYFPPVESTPTPTPPESGGQHRTRRRRPDDFIGPDWLGDEEFLVWFT